jgi:thioredoxin-like negative regulator of GroEL
VVGVNVDEEDGAAEAFLASHPAGFAVAMDASKSCAQAFGVEAMPSSYLVDGQGVVRYVHHGFRPGEAEQVRALVEKLLADPAAAAPRGRNTVAAVP